MILVETTTCSCEWDTSNRICDLDPHCPDHGHLWDGDGAPLTQEAVTAGAPAPVIRDKHDWSL